MSELIIIGYDDHATAEAAQARVLQLQKDFVIDLSGLAVVRVDDDGKKHIDTPGSIVGVSATSGALWGMIIGLLFLVPGVGLLVGGAWGAVAGLAGKAGVNRGLRERVDGLLTPGKSALVVMAKKLTEDKFAAGMAEFGGTVLKTSLSDEAENELVKELKN
ncbi:MAG: DUF1269 domain-containing protein [Propionibacteriaceae bacterium]|nr:DUF1269 domain-containing protein [Propionibacteriaceae bacterium]